MTTPSQKPSNQTPSLRQERITLLTDTLLVQGVSALPWALAIAVLFAFTPELGPLPIWRVACWLGALWAWSAVALSFYCLLKTKQVSLTAGPSIRFFCAVYLMNGLLWGAFVNLMWVEGNVFNNMLIIVIVLGLSVSFGFQLAAHFAVLLCAILPPLVTQFARMSFAGSDYLVPYLFVSPLFTLWVSILSYRLNRQVEDTLKTSILNRRLVEDLRHAHDSALEQKRLADSASQAKSLFLANMSHELRTPLNAIIGFAEIIKDLVYGTKASAKYAEYAGDIERSGRHLLALINQVLDLAKIESGKLVLEREAIKLDDVLRECINLLDAKAVEKGIDLYYENRAPLVTLEADATALRQIFLNIVANAVKFTDRGGVRVLAAIDKGMASIAIEDTGPGIAESDLQRIFDPFEQADNSLARAKEGSGLGLAIVARLIQAHGGRYRVTSREGSGTTFLVQLPLTAASAVAA